MWERCSLSITLDVQLESPPFRIALRGHRPSRRVSLPCWYHSCTLEHTYYLALTRDNPVPVLLVNILVAREDWVAAETPCYSYAFISIYRVFAVFICFIDIFYCLSRVCADINLRSTRVTLLTDNPGKIAPIACRCILKA